MWFGDAPALEAQIPSLLQAGRAAEARALLAAHAEQGSPITQFYLGVATGQLEGEAAACGLYERCLRQLPMMHAARNNLIRGYVQRGTVAAGEGEGGTGDGGGDRDAEEEARACRDREEAMAKAVEHAQLAAGLQPTVAEMQYQLGVVQMRAGNKGGAIDAYEATLCFDPTHRGALVNGAHVLGQFAPTDDAARQRLARIARMGVSAGLWTHELQRPPHLVAGLEARPWHGAAAFGFVALLEAHHAAIRREFVAYSEAAAAAAAAAAGSANGGQAGGGGGGDGLGAVGSRATHDSSLVAAGDWRELPLLGSGRRNERACAACPVTAAVLSRIPEAVELAMAGGGESIFSVLKPGTHLRAHCGSTNARLTCHLGVVVPGGSRIRCGDEWREWEEGKCLVFDDSWEHEVTHDGDSQRVVLLINFWHPGLPPEKRSLEMDHGGYEPV